MPAKHAGFARALYRGGGNPSHFKQVAQHAPVDMAQPTDLDGIDFSSCDRAPQNSAAFIALHSSRDAARCGVHPWKAWGVRWLPWGISQRGRLRLPKAMKVPEMGCAASGGALLLTAAAKELSPNK